MISFWIIKKDLICSLLGQSLTSLCFCFLRYSGVRPFGVSLLVAGFDDKGPQLYQVCYLSVLLWSLWSLSVLEVCLIWWFILCKEIYIVCIDFLLVFHFLLWQGVFILRKACLLSCSLQGPSFLELFSFSAYFSHFRWIHLVPTSLGRLRLWGRMSLMRRHFSRRGESLFIKQFNPLSHFQFNPLNISIHVYNWSYCLI